jgi:regulator of protease activity HflC (stomatin/prohibitin superfamily)
MQGYGQYQAGQAQGEALRYNAAVAESEAESVREKASYEAQMIRKQGQRIIGAQRAGYGSSGFATTTGTPLSVVTATARRAEADAAMRMYSGNVDSTQLQNQATLMRAKAESAESAGKFGMWGSILTGLGQAYMTGNELGLFDKKETKSKKTTTASSSSGNDYGYDWQTSKSNWSLIT